MAPLFWTIFLLYVSAALFYFLRLGLGKQQLSAVALRLTIIAALVQLSALTTYAMLEPKGLNWSYLEYFQLSSLLLAFIFIILCFAKKFFASGPLFITLIVLFNLLSLVLNHPFGEGAVANGSGYFILHLISIFLSLSLFSLSLITAVMFLISERQIKARKFTGIAARFPSLAVLDEVHYKSLAAGFVVFTFSIVTGAGFAKMHTGHYLSADLKQVLSLVGWLFFAVLLNMRFRKGWLGHKGIVLSVFGFAAMILTYFVGIK